ncbi:TRAP transporter large permease [Acuticoccus kandeliae]|uniref:TRAP transporter large permease n=1 Tax=Acuticoccus kandeliae TaxID=2073160 RepID=UPI000D3EB0A7|nr:TRAP transporter large permease subunit [Acuticoccus kandeliae]
MDGGVITLIFAALLLFLAAGFWIAPTLLVTALIAMSLFTSAPAGQVMATTIWSASTNWSLTALPLFIWMGEILFRSRLSEDLFSGLSVWTTRLPGRLLHVNILGCAIFAAVCGSSAATSATVGRISMPALKARGYNEGMAIGTLAGSGTLGLMIPPSIMMIVYGIAAEVSIARLFIAGILPGILLVVLFMGYVVVRSLMNPDLARDVTVEAETTFVEKLRRSTMLIPIVLLIGGVIGSIYAGIATATEAAAVGVFGAFVLSAASGGLTRASFLQSIVGGMRTSCMLTFILVCAAFLSNAMGFTGIPQRLAAGVAGLDLSPALLLAGLTLLFVVLGCFLDGISIVVLTTPIVMPMIQAAGFDVIWFGVYIVIVCEMAQITPPVGLNLYVLQSITRRDIGVVSRATFPFFLLLLIALIVVTLIPGLATFLPRQM